MKYIGFNLVSCLNSIRDNKVSLNDILFIVSNSKCQDKKTFLESLNGYFPLHSTNLKGLLACDENILEIAGVLWDRGKIHQPNLYSDGYNNYMTFVSNVRSPWGIIHPKVYTDNTAVLDAWNNYITIEALCL